MPHLHDLPAPAKINLFLHVTGRRADGYHLLQSAFMLIDWQDTLHIDTRTDGLLRRHDINVALPTDDLCLRAARLLQVESKTTLGCDIHIQKQIPWGAGLGGGSSDAATVLLALNQLWDLNWSRSKLEALAIKLGADVPFFVRGQNAWVEGIGERITPLSLPNAVLNAPLALLKPPVSVPTSAIFSSNLLKRNTKPAIVEDLNAAPRCFGKNDLQAPAEQYSSQISQALQIMQDRFGNSRMTGSGSTVFSWIPTKADDQAPSFQPADLGLIDHAWVGRVSHGLIHHPLLDLLNPIA
ncbi:MAG: 4-(cytidine 5'-diphospho)-2-C-methyl-D-erythritol kinase [Aquabacterium sp.]|nr:4-(cytidine 5'-diphospho)-2-C-methyl-D-erythritol kinase [Aquabacterium sp.]